MKILWVSLAALALDQVSKFAIVYWMNEHQSVQVIGTLVQLTYIHNPGAAFGLRLGGPWLHTVFSLVATGFVVYILWKNKGAALSVRLSLALILGGAFGNLIDRIFFGKVIDFLDIGLGDLRWPTFNVADMAVTAGVILLAFCYALKGEGKASEK